MAASRAAVAGFFRSSSSEAANSARTPPARQARAAHRLQVSRSLKIFGTHVAQPPALLEHAAQDGQVAIGRRGRVAPVGQQRAHGGGVAIRQLVPVERPGVAAIVAQETGDGVQRGADGAPRRRRQPGQVQGDRVAIERDFTATASSWRGGSSSVGG